MSCMHLAQPDAADLKFTSLTSFPLSPCLPQLGLVFYGEKEMVI